MTVYELIMELAKYNPMAEVRIKPSIGFDSRQVGGVSGLDVRAISQGRCVVIERAGVDE